MTSWAVIHEDAPTPEGMPMATDPLLLTALEVAERLGWRVYRVYNWARAGLIPHYRLGLREDVLRFAEAGLPAVPPRDIPPPGDEQRLNLFPFIEGPPMVSDDRFLTVAEVAALLRVDQKTVRRWIWAGEIPHTRLGPKEDVIRIPGAELEKYLDQRLRQHL